MVSRDIRRWARSSRASKSIDGFYAAYADRLPSQDSIRLQGNEYLRREYPQLDSIISTTGHGVLALTVPGPAEITPVRAWMLASRPKTLTAAVAPVLAGAGLAAHHDAVAWLPAFAAMIGAILIQIGTNLANDYYDFVRGGDTDERVGPVRVTQAGILAPRVGEARHDRRAGGSRCWLVSTWSPWPVGRSS